MNSNEQILKKAIEKAVKNGWKHIGMQCAVGKEGMLRGIIYNKEDWKKLALDGYESIIFSHDFAKAFFPKEWGHGERGVLVDNFQQLSSYFKKIKPWQHFLQQMVISEDPILYLEKFL